MKVMKIRQRDSVNRLRSLLSAVNSAIWKTVRHKFYSDDDNLYAQVLKMRAYRKRLKQVIQTKESKDAIAG